MSDAELVSELQAIFDANDPSDGIDRHDGYGRDYRVATVGVVESDDGFDDLEVTVVFGRKQRTARLLLDRAWREASGLDDASAYAAYVVARWQFSRGGDGVPPGRSRVRTAAEASVPDVDESWQVLLNALGKHHAVVGVAGGTIEVTDEQGETFWVHVTPEQWRSYVVDCEVAARNDRGVDALRPGDGPGEAYFQLDELTGSRWDDEHHLVFFRGGFERSVRAELPPVRSLLLREPIEPLEGGSWRAVPPEDD